jgi:hypothetical protein
MSPVADPEECTHQLERQAVVLDRGSALQPDEEISNVHVERPGNRKKPTRRDAIGATFVLMQLLATDANLHRHLLLCHSDKDALHPDPLPHMSIDIARSNAPRDSLTGDGVVGRTISGLHVEEHRAHQSCRRYRRVARFIPTSPNFEKKTTFLLEFGSILP